MTPTALAKWIRQRLDALADDATRQKYERLVPGAKVLGVSVPTLRALAAQVKKEQAGLTLDDACDLMTRLCASQVREEMFVGIFVLGRFGKSVRTIPWHRIEDWVPSLDNWETCDQLASNVASAVVAADPKLAARLVRFAKSKSRWARRFAVATAADLTHAGRGLTEPAFRVCTEVLQDEDAMVQTSIGWAIREASKADETAAFEFLIGARSRMRPRTVREASAKLTSAHRKTLLEARQ